MAQLPHTDMEQVQVGVQAHLYTSMALFSFPCCEPGMSISGCKPPHAGALLVPHTHPCASLTERLRRCDACAHTRRSGAPVRTESEWKWGSMLGAQSQALPRYILAWQSGLAQGRRCCHADLRVAVQCTAKSLELGTQPRSISHLPCSGHAHRHAPWTLEP